MRAVLLASIVAILTACDTEACTATVAVTPDGQHWVRLSDWDAYALGAAVEYIDEAAGEGYLEPDGAGCYTYGPGGYLCTYGMECAPGVVLVGLPLLHELDDAPDNGCTGLAGPWGSVVLDTETGYCLGILDSPRGPLGVVLAVEPPL